MLINRYKVLHIILAMALAMALSGAPLMVSADPVQEVFAIDKGSGGVQKFVTLADAILAAEDGNTIKLLASYEEVGGNYSIKHNLALDLGGHGFELKLTNSIITVTNAGYLRVINSESTPALLVATGTIMSAYDGISAEGEFTNISYRGSIDARGDGIYAFGGATVIVDGSIKAVTNGIYAHGVGTKVVFTGDISEAEYGIIAYTGAEVITIGNITNSVYGIYTGPAGAVTAAPKVTHIGKIESTGDGVTAWGVGTLVTVTGNITADCGVAVSDSATVEVRNTVISASSFGANVESASLKVTGDIISELDGIIVYGEKARVDLNGDILAKDGCGIYVVEFVNQAGEEPFDREIYTDDVLVIMAGDIKASVYGMGIYGGSDITVSVDGNIEAGFCGIDVLSDALVYVSGDINVTASTAPVGEILVGVFAASGAHVFIGGKINAPKYIAFAISKDFTSFEFVGATNHDLTSLESGYLQYSHSKTPDTYVWVADTGQGLPFTPPTGQSLCGPAAVLILLAIGGFCLQVSLARRNRQQGD